MRKRFLSLLMALCLVVSLVPVTHASAANQKSIVYIPLDDRSYNDSRVKTMAASLNYDLVMPDADLYSTRLDSQAPNSNGTRYGDRGALLAWLMEMDEGHDTFILSLDQLLSGGLMNSRVMEDMTPIELPDGTTMTEYEVIDYLAELSQNNEVYIIDSVLRLASSAEFAGYRLDHYYALRQFAMAPRPVLTGDDLALDKIFETYYYAEDGVTPAYEVAGLSDSARTLLLSPIDRYYGTVSQALQEAYSLHQDVKTVPAFELTELEPEADEAVASTHTARQKLAAEGTEASSSDADPSLMEVYFQIRQRKLRLNDYALRALGNMKNVHYLMGVDDSSEGNNIHTNEINYLRTLLPAGGEIISSLDGMGQLALSKIFLTDHGNAPTVSVTYLGDSIDDVQEYNNTSTAQLINQVLGYLGSHTVTENPDASLVVISSSDDTNTTQRNLTKLVHVINSNEANGIPTILMDLTGSRNNRLWDMLLENVHLGSLVGYSGLSDGPNRVIMALSQGLSRTRALTLQETTSELCNYWHLQNLSVAYAEDFAYKRFAGPESKKLVTSMGRSTSNFGVLTEEEAETIRASLQANMETGIQGFVNNLIDGGYLAAQAPYTVKGVENITLETCWQPYNRTNEIEVRLQITQGDATAPSTFHKSFVDGTTDTTFSPDALLTREQAAKILVGASGIDIITPDTPCPDDVAAWAWPYVYTCMQKGYMRGYSDGTFRGGNCITRGEFATLFLQYAKAEGISLPVVRHMTFTDLERGGPVWCAENVYALADAGYINGYPDGTYGTDNNISRAEAVVLFTRIMGRSEALSDSLSKTARFTDVPVGMWCFREIQEASISHYSKS